MKTYKFKPRWKISTVLYTHSPLHIGCNETLNDPNLPDVKNLSACIKDHNDRPYIPGATLKGDLLAWLKLRMDNEHEDLIALFGKDSKNDKPGSGGRAEFHDAYLKYPLDSAVNYPYWQKERQTYVEVSTAINRITRTVADRKLYHSEAVPPGVGFEVIITGMMSENQAAILIAALQAFNKPDEAATIGAGTASGKGRLSLYFDPAITPATDEERKSWLITKSSDQTANPELVANDIEVGRLDKNQVLDWLIKNEQINPVEHSMTMLSPQQVKDLAETGKRFLPANKMRQLLEVTLQMDGPFLINNPQQAGKQNGRADKNTHSMPLCDKNGNPRLNEKSLRGAMRSQAERILRTLGIPCCDTNKPCEPINDKSELENLCLACQVFGAAGWQSPVHIHPFTCVGQPVKETQQFVAIDRFHGGGKDGALFSATYFISPAFTGVIEIDEARLPKAGEGLLALLWRDLKEGDIKLGFGVNKGYGGVKSVTMTPETFTDEHIKALKKFPLTSQTSPAQSTADSKAQNNSTEKGSSGIAGDFYNPYHFIPVKEPDDKSHWLDKDQLVKQLHHHSHALYYQRTESGENYYHGRLACRLSAETAFFIGSEKKDTDNLLADGSNAPVKVDNYKLNGQLAIPASSLRGLISSLAETASNSAMRVLDDGLLSYRKDMDADKPLSKIGIVVERKEGLKLIELKHKVYLKDAYTGAMENFLQNKSTWSVDKPEIYYLNPSVCACYEKLKLSDGILSFALKPEDNPEDLIIPAHLAVNWQKTEYTPGILRILGKDKRNDMPDTKRHEFFLPVPRRFVDDLAGYLHNSEALPFSPETKKRFEDLADQRCKTQKNESPDFPEEQRLPFHLKGTKREADNTLRLKHGDLVYYQTNNQGQIDEVSFSALWRGRVENNNHQAASVFAFFPKDLRPFRKGRDSLSPAELLFGFVEDQKDLPEADKDKALAFAGKVRISAGRLINPDNKPNDAFLDSPVPLKILSSPKLPSPALYFREKANPENCAINTSATNYVPKNALCPEQHQAKGRKHYLHALRSDTSATVQKLNSNGIPCNNKDGLVPWETRDATKNTDQKVTITPIQPKTQFEFHVDFDNLNEWELGLLCYVLKPLATYRHKLGMGKPIGLGSVNIAIEKLELIDRYQRYAKDGLNAKRYNVAENPDLIEILHKQFRTAMDSDIRQALELLGNPDNVKAPVHYPQVRREDIEVETYQWFVNNDKGGKQQLASIDAGTTQLPPLQR